MYLTLLEKFDALNWNIAFTSSLLLFKEAWESDVSLLLLQLNSNLLEFFFFWIISGNCFISSKSKGEFNIQNKNIKVNDLKVYHN